MIRAAKPLAVAIMGPTASGKTAAALQIAQQIPSEIISVDSALVYRGMDIGTAKPSVEEQATVQHHLIDILDPSASYSVMQFRQDAIKLVSEINARGNLALLVGGTMLYFKGLRDGLDALPEADPTVRSELDSEFTQFGSPAMHQRLQALDPVTAMRLKPNDTQRIHRALEIIQLTGLPMSDLLAKTEKPELPFQLMSFSLEPSDRSVLHERISRRFDVMLTAQPSLIDEVKALRQRGDLHLGLPSMRCVGYRQAWEHLEGKTDLASMRELGIIATRQLAKRQLTWLRSMEDRISLDCLSSDLSGQLLRHIKPALG
ncbi:MAG: tRNA (adenosine(37)-N6)-dimethylallyltransferase MiaA [Burkholderiales bacterium]|nr:tRNA (adenosine(37)-N6)-dimethylallyltransferase MiaA [Burkholderiales bacterium]